MLDNCKGVLDAQPLQSGGFSVRLDFPDGMCWGAANTMEALARLKDAGNGERMLGVCSPLQATPMQFVRIFAAYANAHPEKQHLDFAWVALEALMRAFPCQPGGEAN